MPETQTKSFLNDLSLIRQKNYESRVKSFVLYQWDFLAYNPGAIFSHVIKCDKRSKHQHHIIKQWNSPYYIDKDIDNSELDDIVYLAKLHLINVHKFIYNNANYRYDACKLQLSALGKKFYHIAPIKTKCYLIPFHNSTETYLKLCHKELSINAINSIRKILYKEYIATACPCRDYYPLVRHVFSQL